MLTRRTFFASLAALAVSPRVVVAAAPPEVAVQFVGFTSPPNRLLVAKEGATWLYGQKADGLYGWMRTPRRDDDDTILELR